MTFNIHYGNTIGNVVGAGIAIIVLAAVAIALICFWKKFTKDKKDNFLSNCD